MSAERWAGFIALLTYVGLRLTDYLLPRGRHWRWIDRWTSPDEPAKPEDEEG